MLKMKDFFCAFVCAVVGSLQQILYVFSFHFASAKLVSVVSTLVPGLVHQLNVFNRTEKFLTLKTLVVSGFSIVGAVLLGFLNKGPLTANSDVFSKISPGLKHAIAVSLALLSSSNLAAWVTNYAQENMSRDFRFTNTMSMLIKLIEVVFSLVGIYVVPHASKGIYYLGPHAKIVVCMVPLVSLATAAATWCVKRKGTTFAAKFSNISLVIDAVAAPLVLEGKLELGSGLNLICVFMSGLASACMTTDADPQEMSSGGDQLSRKHYRTIINNCKGLASRCKPMYHFISLSWSWILSAVNSHSELEQTNNPMVELAHVSITVDVDVQESIELESSNTVVESATEIKVGSIDDQDEEINYDIDEGGGIEGTGMDSGHGRGADPCEATGEPGPSNTVEESATDDQDEESSHDDEGGGMEGTERLGARKLTVQPEPTDKLAESAVETGDQDEGAGIDSGHDGGGLEPREVT